MRVHFSRSSRRFLGPPIFGLLLGITQPACHMLQKVESKSEAAHTVEPGLVTLSPDQMSHLKTTVVGKATWAVAVHTTGTVDWDADQTTQAITQVNGPISRILVDAGAPVKKGDPLLYVASPDLAAAISTYRKAYNRQAFNQRNVDRMKELLDQGAIALKPCASSASARRESWRLKNRALRSAPNWPSVPRSPA
jgi:cobalt-zinc-cadmium efflux system membrane fusion protein